MPTDSRALYTSLVQALEQRFGDGPQRYLHHAQSRHRRQAPGETLSQLADDIERLTRLSFVGSLEDALDAVGTAAFIDAIASTDIQVAVRLSHSRTLRAAHIYALEVEAARKVSRLATKPKYATADPSLPKVSC